MKDQIFDVYDLIGREHVLLSVGTLGTASDVMAQLDALAKEASDKTMEEFGSPEELVKHPKQMFQLFRYVFETLHELRNELQETIDYETQLQQHFIEKENPILKDEKYGMVCTGGSPKERLELKVVLAGSDELKALLKKHRNYQC
jgi:hypothetical protein